MLQRLLGGRPGTSPEDAPPADPATVAAEERDHELTLARDEQDRLDELQQRQLRYADYAWQPPAQGGGRRAEDGDGQERA